MISIAASDAISQGATFIEAKLVFPEAAISGFAGALDPFGVRDGGPGCFALTREVVASGCDAGSRPGESRLLFLDPDWSNDPSSLDEYDDIEAISFCVLVGSLAARCRRVTANFFCRDALALA